MVELVRRRWCHHLTRHGATSSSSSSSLVTSPSFCLVVSLYTIVPNKYIIIIRGVSNSKVWVSMGKWKSSASTTTTTTTTEKRWETRKCKRPTTDIGRNRTWWRLWNNWFTGMMWSESSKYFTRFRFSVKNTKTEHCWKAFLFFSKKSLKTK